MLAFSSIFHGDVQIVAYLFFDSFISAFLKWQHESSIMHSYSCVLASIFDSVLFVSKYWSRVAALMMSIQVLCTSTGGKARLSEGCSFRKKQD
jgi:hypothetical protein